MKFLKVMTFMVLLNQSIYSDDFTNMFMQMDIKKSDLLQLVSVYEESGKINASEAKLAREKVTLLSPKDILSLKKKAFQAVSSGKKFDRAFFLEIQKSTPSK